MSISSFLSAAIDNLETGRYDVSLSLVCSAVDSTASKEYPQLKSNNSKYKSFLKDNMGIITTFGFPGISASGIKIKCHNIEELRTDNNGYVGIEDILYHVIRCSLIHQCEIDKKIELIDETYIGDFNDKFKLPKNVIYGLIMSVVLSKINTNERLEMEVKIPSIYQKMLFTGL